MLPTLTVRAAGPDDYAQLIAFRKDQYQTAKEFSLQDYNLLHEVLGVNVLVLQQDNLLAAMQLEPIPDKDTFENHTGMPLLPEEIAFPTFYLGKAGTQSQYRKLGLNSLIRKYILEYALAHATVASFTAAVYQTAPRLNTLERLGYSFREIKEHYPDYLTTNACYLVQLPRAKFARALELTNTELQPLFNSYQIEFAPWWP
jgi:hypothetical protein